MSAGAPPRTVWPRRRASSRNPSRRYIARTAALSANTIPQIFPNCVFAKALSIDIRQPGIVVACPQKERRKTTCAEST